MDDHAFARFAEGGAHAVLDRLSGDAAFAEPAAALLERFRAPWDRAARLALAAEYGRLFHGAGGRRAVPPSQSAFLNEASHGAPWRAMTALLADSGAAVPAGCSEPADHIAIQLLLAAHLHRTHADAAAAGDTAAATTASDRLDRLRADHLAAWGPQFCARVAEADRDGFYRAAADFVARLLDLDTDAADENGEQKPTMPRTPSAKQRELRERP
ncbi:MAG: molecular chaperone TorD family protein [Rhodospirillaceae bacterium]|nr:molecular chaperone TorD family protein [Rhodospirillaceae bacterium]MCA8933577.1 molecular chaperone TorD family protein [Rhodospirillaceae bacterium]